MATPKTIGAAERQEAARALEELAARQQRAAMSNLQRLSFLQSDDPAMHQRALQGLRQAVGHCVPGWADMVAIVAMLTGEDPQAVRQKVEKRFTDRERKRITWEARRGMIEGNLDDRCLLDALRRLPKETQWGVERYIRQRAAEAVCGEPKPSRPFSVVEGGRDDAS